MPRQLAWMLSGFCLFLAMASAAAADLIVYDDQSENGFNDGCSFGGVASDFDVANTTVVHSGTHSIRFTPDNFNAVSWCAPATYSAAIDYIGIDFWVNGGATGGQNVDVVLGLTGNLNPVAFANLTSLNGGNPIPAGAWTHITAPFTSGALAYNGQFDKISLQDESNAVQADMYFDDVSLIASSASGQNSIFADSFEPEYLFVPQYTSHSIKVYQRVINPGVNPQFTLINTAALGAGISPNAVAVAPDGNLWVLDDPAASLRRYSLANMVGNASPVADQIVGPVGNGTSIFDMAFFGTNAYVSQSDFGATNQILKFTLSNLNAGTNTSTSLTNASVSAPVALAFDPQGRLWVASFGNNTIARMNTSSGAIDKSIGTVTANVFKDLEGLAFDQYGSLWVGNNGVPSAVVYTDSQLSAAGVGTSADPTYQIDLSTANPHAGGVPTGFAGGIAFDKNGSLWINYEFSLSVLEYSLASAHAPPGAGDYSITLLPELSSATTDPGRGGIAIWPVPSTVHR